MKCKVLEGRIINDEANGEENLANLLVDLQLFQCTCMNILLMLISDKT